jgi:YbbR domain-containing protein
MGGAAMTSNWYYRILALFLAVLSWYLVTGREKVDTWVQVRIDISGLGEDMVLRGTPRGSLDVLVRGPKGLASKLEPGGPVYTLDARKLVPGRNTVVVQPDAIPIPKIFEVVEVRPSALELFVERRLSKSVPVRSALLDGAARDYTVEARFEPSSVSVTGPESVVQGIMDVPVQPLALPAGPSGTFDTMDSLVLPDQVEASPRMVKAHIQYQLITRDVEAEVKLRAEYHGRGAVSMTPGSVLIRFKVPVTLAHDDSWRGLLDAFVEIDPKTVPGRRDMTYRVTLPQGCELIQARPEKVTVQVK